MAPDARLVSLKVMANDADSSDVIRVMAALRYVMRIKRQRQAPRIHGVNLSLGYEYDPHGSRAARARCARQSTGSSARASWSWWRQATLDTRRSARRRAVGTGGLTLSINDPGNADRAITVGATHRSRLTPTGCRTSRRRGRRATGGRNPTSSRRASGSRWPPRQVTLRPPSRDVLRCIGHQLRRAPRVRSDRGVSVRAPRVRRRPERVKQILVESAQPLGRERQFEGGGLLDIMRALQSV